MAFWNHKTKIANAFASTFPKPTFIPQFAKRGTIGTLPVFISFPHEGKRPFFLKIDNRLEEMMLESLTEVIPSTAGEIEAKPTTTSVRPKAMKKGDVTAPIPGKVTSIKVSEGAKVNAGKTLLTVEAMKMENEVHTPMDGIVKKIYVKVKFLIIGAATFPLEGSNQGINCRCANFHYCLCFSAYFSISSIILSTLFLSSGTLFLTISQTNS